MTHPIDTSPEAIAALLDELRTIGCHENGDARCTCGIGQNAADLITRLTAERDAAWNAAIRAAADIDTLLDAMDNVHDMDVTLRDYAAAASRAILALLKPEEKA